MTKSRIGALCWTKGKLAKVLRHGRDRLGVYIEVAYPDGTTERCHPEAVTEIRETSEPK